MYQIVNISSTPNQAFLANLSVNGTALKLNLTISFNEIAQYWTMGIADVNGVTLIAEVPLLTGTYPAANLLAQFQYMNIGAAYLLNVSNGSTTLDYPNGQDLGTDFALLWGDNV